VADLLASAGVDLDGAEGVTVFAPDGFGKDFSLAEIDRRFPNGTLSRTARSSFTATGWRGPEQPRTDP
jgi:hypothetical protein